MGQFKFAQTQTIILCKARLLHKKQSILVKLAVDTGATFTMISVENALAIGLDPSTATRHIEVTTANGVVFAPLIEIPSFQCLGITVKDMEVICHNLPPESPVEGLLGLNFLKAAKVIIDFSENTIRTAL